MILFIRLNEEKRQKHSQVLRFMEKELSLESEFKMGAGQAEAVEKLAGLSHGLSYQTLLGVTGSGKTFAIANIAQTLQRPAIVLAPNKTLAAQLYGELKGVFS